MTDTNYIALIINHETTKLGLETAKLSTNDRRPTIDNGDGWPEWVNSDPESMNEPRFRKVKKKKKKRKTSCRTHCCRQAVNSVKSSFPGFVFTRIVMFSWLFSWEIQVEVINHIVDVAERGKLYFNSLKYQNRSLVCCERIQFQISTLTETRLLLGRMLDLPISRWHQFFPIAAQLRVNNTATTVKFGINRPLSMLLLY